MAFFFPQKRFSKDLVLSRRERNSGVAPVDVECGFARAVDAQKGEKRFGARRVRSQKLFDGMSCCTSGSGRGV